jgi:hypothetical protein
MSVVATAGAAAWVAPEILTAKPAAGATLSGGTSSGGGTNGVSTRAATTASPGTTGTGGANGVDAVTAGTTTPVKSLAFTGLDLRRDAEIGAALVAGGWAMQHWATRTPGLAADCVTEAHEAGSLGEPA